MKGVETVAVKVCGMQLNEDDKARSFLSILNAAEHSMRRSIWCTCHRNEVPRL